MDNQIHPDTPRWRLSRSGQYPQSAGVRRLVGIAGREARYTLRTRGWTGRGRPQCRCRERQPPSPMSRRLQEGDDGVPPLEMGEESPWAALSTLPTDAACRHSDEEGPSPSRRQCVDTPQSTKTRTACMLSARDVIRKRVKNGLQYNRGHLNV